MFVLKINIPSYDSHSLFKFNAIVITGFLKTLVVSNVLIIRQWILSEAEIFFSHCQVFA